MSNEPRDGDRIPVARSGIETSERRLVGHLVFDAQSGDWSWAPLPPAATKEPAPDNLKGSVADFLRAGLRNIDADMVNPENRDNLWRQGYHAASKHLARDLCRHLDIAWDDKTHEPAKGA